MNLDDYMAGKHEEQYEYRSFLPTQVNHSWIISDSNLQTLLGEADRALGQLETFSQIVPDIDFFILMHILKEATQSSRIEGTQTNMEDAFLREQEVAPEQRDDWQEVQNYIAAINQAISQLEKLPLSNRLLKDTHQRLMQSVRGREKRPGEFRKSQNWIGVSLRDAEFIPPHHSRVESLMSDLEKFIQSQNTPLPHLIRIGIAHYQFETIHPFLDGNGRLGRLMIALYFANFGLLSKPALYLSDYFERNKVAYVDRLMGVRLGENSGDQLKQWLTFFLHGVHETALDSIRVFKDILALKQRIEQEVLPRFSARRQSNAQELMMFLYQNPFITIREASEFLDVPTNTAKSLVTDFVKYGVLVSVPTKSRGQRFGFTSYLSIFTGKQV